MDALKISLLVIFPMIVLLIPFYLEKKSLPAWLIRKYVHSVGLTITAIYGAFLDEVWEIVVTVLALLIIFGILTIPKSIRAIPRLFSMGTRPGENSKVSIINTTFTMSTAFIILLFLLDQRWIFMAAILTVAIGDGLGEFIGRPYGKHKYKIIYPKSIEGSIGVFVGSLLGIIIASVLFQMFDLTYVWIFVLIAFIDMIIESISLEFIDNVAMQVVTALMLIALI